MQITFETFEDKPEYQSLLIIGAENKWKETLYFTFFTPWGENEEKLYAGRYMADVHFKNKPCECVFVFDFHRWSEETVKAAMQMEFPTTAFQSNLEELLQKALQERDGNSASFSVKVKEKK